MKKSDSTAARFLHPASSLGRPLPWRELLVILALGCLIGTGWISFRDMNQLASAEHWEKHTYEVILKFEQLMSSMKDAETGQRGYLLTGRDDYLAPYVNATIEVDKLHKTLMLLTADNPAQQRRLAEIASLTQARMQILEKIIDLRREQGFDAAVKVVRMGQSKAIMDAVRQHISEAQAEEERLLAERTATKVYEARGTTWTLSLAGIVGGTLLVAMLITLYRESAHCKRLAEALQRHQVNLEYLVQTRTAELGKSETRLKTLIEHAPAALAMLDRNLCYLAASRRWREEFQIGDQDIVGRPHDEVFPETPERWKEAYRRALAGEVLRGDAERFERADGSVQWFSWEIRPWHDESRAVGGIGIFTKDITDLKQAELGLAVQRQRLAGIVDSAMDAIIGIDARQRIVLFNGAAEKMFHCPAHEALGSSIERFIPARFRAAHAGHVSLFGDTGETSRTMGRLEAVYGLRADGQEFPIEASISQIEVHNEKLYTVILRDISTRVAAEEEIRRMNAELEARVESRTAELREAVQELETFAYAVSHDLRAPLRAINGFANILAREYGSRLNETGTQYLGHVIDGAQRMRDLIEGLLQLSRSSRGEFVKKPVDLSALARRIMEELAVAEPGRQVRYEIEDGLEAEGDPRMLEALMRNLLGNAWKYTAKAAEAQIRFYRDRTTHPPRFCVADNGAGFDMAHADKLFQPFRRLHGQDEFAGIGIGLATVQRIVQRHGGEIGAEAEPGKGARFCFTLPD